MRSRLRFALALLSLFLAACDDDPVGITGATTLVYEYASTVQPGSVPPGEGGFCAHHMLGSSWLYFVTGSTEVVPMFRVGNEPPRYRGSNVVTPAGIEYRLVIRDLECCSHTVDEPCWATEGLVVNGVPLTRVVPLPTETEPERVGLAFRVDRSGRVLP